MSTDSKAGPNDGDQAHAAGPGHDPIIIKKYANRRLYNTQSSSYITLEHLAQMTREGVEFRVLDAKTSADITHQILTQIIMEEEASGEPMLPLNFLRQLISMYGNSMQTMFPQYLEATMAQFSANQAKLRAAFEAGLEANPFTRLAQQNMAMFQAAASAFMPGAEPSVAKSAPAPSDLDALRAQMVEMQRRLDQLAK